MPNHLTLRQQIDPTGFRFPSEDGQSFTDSLAETIGVEDENAPVSILGLLKDLASGENKEPEKIKRKVDLLRAALVASGVAISTPERGPGKLVDLGSGFKGFLPGQKTNRTGRAVAAGLLDIADQRGDIAKEERRDREQERQKEIEGDRARTRFGQTLARDVLKGEMAEKRLATQEEGKKERLSEQEAGRDRRARERNKLLARRKPQLTSPRIGTAVVNGKEVDVVISRDSKTGETVAITVDDLLKASPKSDGNNNETINVPNVGELSPEEIETLLKVVPKAKKVKKEKPKSSLERFEEKVLNFLNR